MLDFPLVSVALSYDGANPLDHSNMLTLVQMLPAVETIFHMLSEVLGTRDPESWKAKGPGEVLTRNATATRQDYEGKKTMKVLAFYLMRKAAEKGYRGINIETVHDAVAHVWTHPLTSPRQKLLALLTLLRTKRRMSMQRKLIPSFQ
jgi:hypothetical protein